MNNAARSSSNTAQTAALTTKASNAVTKTTASAKVTSSSTTTVNKATQTQINNAVSSLAAKKAGIDRASDGSPRINNGYDAERYMNELNKLRGSEDRIKAAKAAGIGVNSNGEPKINGAVDGFLSGTIIGGATGAISASANIATGSVKIIGSAQKTGTAFHKAASNLEAGKMAVQFGRYSKIGLNRALKTVGLNGRQLPDVTGVARFGTNKLVEVVSKTQTTQQMATKCISMTSHNPNTTYKVVSWAKNFTRKFLSK